MDELLRGERLPHIWCQGCGLGTALTTFIGALQWLEKNKGWDLDKVAVVSGIGCTGRIAGYVRLDSFHTTHGRALPFATGLKIANPELKVVVISGDGDIAGIGGNHFIHAARRNLELAVICVNNFNYGMTGGQVGPTTPHDARAVTSQYGNFEYPFNLPYLAAASGASFVARWTVLHARQLEWTLREALVHPGFSFVEVIAPCSTAYARWNPEGRGLDPESLGRRGLETMKFYQKVGRIANGTHPKDAHVQVNEKGEITEIVEGKFLDDPKPDLKAAIDQQAAQAEKWWLAEKKGTGRPAPGCPADGSRAAHRGAARWVWRAGHHQRRPDHRPGGSHVRRAGGLLYSELRPRGARRRGRLAGGRLQRSDPPPTPDPADQHDHHVAGCVRQVRARSWRPAACC